MTTKPGESQITILCKTPNGETLKTVSRGTIKDYDDTAAYLFRIANKSLAKMRVFCSKCVHHDQRCLGTCTHRQTRNITSNWYEETETFALCQDINRDNNCPHFEPMEPKNND